MSRTEDIVKQLRKDLNTKIGKIVDDGLLELEITNIFIIDIPASVANYWVPKIKDIIDDKNQEQTQNYYDVSVNYNHMYNQHTLVITKDKYVRT